MTRFVLLSFMLLIPLMDGAKILVFNPKFGISHMTFTGKIADTLADAGHEIVVYQPILNENITISGSKHKSIRYISKPKNFSICKEYNIEEAQGLLWEADSISKMRRQSNLMFNMKHEFCVDILNDRENLAKLKAENFDLGVTEIFESCGFAVFEMIGLKKYIATVGGAYSAMHMDFLGIPVPFSYTPGMMSENTDQMDFFGRFKNALSVAGEIVIGGKLFVGGAEAALHEVQGSGTSVRDVIRDSVFFFVNSDEIVDYTLPSTPKIVFIGGMGKIQSKPLEKKYTDIFDSAKKGVILFSFGSVVRSTNMLPEIKQAFLEAFAEFPEINFLWKYEEEDDIGKGHKNVFKDKWLPQPDILDHPKLLAFISHGGMNSVLEGATKGVPMICVPIFADQGHNAQLLFRRGTAITINKFALTKDNIVAAIKEIISNKKYKENAQLLAKMVRAKPTSADERIVKFTEFAAKFGDAQPFQTAGRYMHFIQLYSIDIIAAYFALIGVVLWILFLILRALFRLAKRMCCGSPNKKVDTKDKKNQ